jgi:cytochrome c556
MKFLSRLVLALSTLSLVGGASLAFAQFQKPDDAIRYRKAVFEVISVQFGDINQALTKGPLVQKEVAHEADLVESLSELPWQAFLPGTQIASQSRARPEIWKDQAGFKKAVDDYKAKTVALAAAAKSSDQGAIKVAFEATAKSCKDCHEQYRVK